MIPPPALSPSWGPASDGLDLPYWEGLRSGELRVQRCDDCSAWMPVPSWLCRACHGFDLSWLPVEAVGRVHSWIRTWRPSVAEYADRSPLITILVELASAPGVRTLGLLADDGLDVAIGQGVRGGAGHNAGPGWELLVWRTVP